MSQPREAVVAPSATSRETDVVTSGGDRRSRTSRALHHVGEIASSEWTAAAVSAAVAAWVGLYAARGFPPWMAATLEITAASMTLVMVFVIQHTQRRRWDATQLKLDELVRASGADDSIAEIEVDGDELERRRRDRGGR
ncbi:MAG: low affinity iron permease family protein [Microthrixaceae bacterium]